MAWIFALCVAFITGIVLGNQATLIEVSAVDIDKAQQRCINNKGVAVIKSHGGKFTFICGDGAVFDYNK